MVNGDTGVDSDALALQVLVAESTPNNAGRQRFTASVPRLLPAAPEAWAFGARLKLSCLREREVRAVDEISDCLSSHLLSTFKRSIAHVYLG